MKFRLERRGILLVLSAPSGGGKSAALRRLLSSDRSVHYSISYTSRAPRPGEIDGRDYHFVSLPEFRRMAEADDFYEYAEVHGNMYGTSAKVVQEALDAREDIALDIDVQGGMTIKKRDPGAVLVFLMPPSMEVLEQRLRGRGSDAEEHIQLRLANARREIEHWPQYDYVVVNENLEEAVREIASILQAERRRASRFQLNRGG